MSTAKRGEIIDDMYEFLMNNIVMPKCAFISEKTRLFHCTTPDALFGMTSTNSIWLTDVGMMNDPSEHEYGLTLVETKIDQRLGMLSDGYQRRALEGLRAYLTADEQPSRNIQRPFAFSFCAEHDVLLHWREYGNGGRGVELEFSMQDLNQIFRSPSSDLKLALMKVHCDPDVQASVIANVLNEFEILAVTWLSGATNSFQWNDLLIYLSVIFRDLFAFLVSSFKAPAYLDEREVRLFAYPKLIQWENDFSYLKKRRTRYGEAAYFALPSANKLSITRVTRGPLCEITQEEIQAKLRVIGREDIEVIDSLVPMRA